VFERAGEMGAYLRSDSFLNYMDDTNGSSHRKPLKIARDVFIHYDNMEMDGEEIAGRFRVENGKIHSVKFEKTDLKLESVVVGKKFENWKEFIQKLEIIV
jgi:hypothetical protein